MRLALWSSLHLRLAMVLSVGVGALVGWSLYPEAVTAPAVPVESVASIPAGSHSRESVEHTAPRRPMPGPDRFDEAPPEPAQAPPEPAQEIPGRSAAGAVPPPEPQLAFDPRRLRRIMDLGVETYGSAANDPQRVRGAKLLQLVALLGYSPARRLVVHNYPLAAAMRKVAPEADTVSYALALLAIDSANVDGLRAGPLNARTLVIALGRFFSALGATSRFATAVTQGLRADAHYRGLRDLEMLLGALSEVPDACTSIASVIATTAAPDPCGPALSRDLLAFTQTQAPLDMRPDARRRALVLAAELGKLP